jgi:hypothetical protein
MKNRNLFHISLLIVILFVGFALRFYDFFNLPFTWDELSAWHRLNFDSFSDLIQYGVKPDGHPAGIQVFLYYWTNLFGDKEWIVKLPFNLMGLFSVFLTYKIGEIWFGKNTGLLAASFVASLQFFVLYSTLARPYSSGLFFCSFMVYFWSLYLFKSPKKLYLLFYILFAALSAYNHHFSLLFAAIVGFSGLLIVPKNLLFTYILAGISIFVLYTPHLNIFFHQLNVGGIGGEGLWLSKPEWSFFSSFYYWVFQFSFIKIVFAASLLIASLFYAFSKKLKRLNKKIIILLIWSFSSLIVGFLYSIYINPVLQYSMLIFSIPYLFILFSLIAERLSKTLAFVLVVVVLIANSTQLIFNRQHYKIIKSQPFDVLAKEAQKTKGNSFSIYNSIPSYQGYYFDKYSLDSANSFSIYNKEISHKTIDSIVSSRTEDFIISCALPPEYEPIIKRSYPFFVKRINAYTADCYVFSKIGEEKPIAFSEEIFYADFTNENSRLNFQNSRIKTDSLQIKSYIFNSNHEWGFNFVDTLSNYPKNCILDMEATITILENSPNPIWVFSANKNNESIFWRGKKIETFPDANNHNKNTYYSIDTRWIKDKDASIPILFKSYFWNKASTHFSVYDLKVSQRPANPIKYGLFEKI